jgi:transcription-repair coupling factor (superfamily II helicase)
MSDSRVIDELIRSVQGTPAFRRLCERIDGGGEVDAEGLWGSSGALLVAALQAELRRPVAVLVPGEEEAERWAVDLGTFSGDQERVIHLRPSLGEGERHTLAEYARLRVLMRIYDRARGPWSFLVAGGTVWKEGVPAVQWIRRCLLRLRVGDSCDIEELLRRFIDAGYERAHRVEIPGQVGRRGGILDVFAPPWERPIRLEWEGEELVSIRFFDSMTQRSEEERSELELILDSRGCAPERVSIRDALPPEALVASSESSGEGPPALVRLSELPLGGKEAVGFSVSSVDGLGSAGGEEGIRRGIDRLLRETRRGKRIYGFYFREAEAEQLDRWWGGPSASAGPDAPCGFIKLRGVLHRGFSWEEAGVVCFGYGELSGTGPVLLRSRGVRGKPAGEGVPLDDFLELRPGEWVVHLQHGVGIYRGLVSLGAEEKGEKQGEFLKIEYAEKAVVYVPTDQFDLVRRYVGVAGIRPAPARLGGGRWKGTLKKAAQAAGDLAADLLRVQAERRLAAGIAYPPDDPMQRAFELRFPYEETPDQLSAMEEIRRDMESPRPMDRLLCGDVGYGKTELALRAAFKAVLAGRQVAVLVPTTVLALQHHRTFSRRMADVPVRVEMLSRFRTASEQEVILGDLEKGAIDIVVGTHRLLQGDVRFRDLGLVILDEEQRFGVEQKQRLLRLRSTVDLLTLTATPIPRTLHMAMVGLRDISNLTTAPRDRMSIRTRISRFEPVLVREGIRRELDRDGQVYFLHNRIYSIYRVAERLREIIPEARIGIGHGRLPREELERVMIDFLDRKIDVLLATTIIESGIDIPNVNTIFIDQADRYGLAQLHQLRGRVGRYNRQAYCHLLLSPDQPPTSKAASRLKAIEEYSELGAGFQIAMRDLEIRGAGNLLGAEQAGQIASVGYDLYCRLLQRAVRRLSGEGAPSQEKTEWVAEGEPHRVVLDLPGEATLPESYVPYRAGRIEIYRRLALARARSDVEDLEKELRDRFGPLPEEAGRMLEFARWRLGAAKLGIDRIYMIREGICLRAESASSLAAALRERGAVVRPIDSRTVLVPLSEGSSSVEEQLRVLRGG